MKAPSTWASRWCRLRSTLSTCDSTCDAMRRRGEQPLEYHGTSRQAGRRTIAMAFKKLSSVAAVTSGLLTTVASVFAAASAESATTNIAAPSSSAESLLPPWSSLARRSRRSAAMRRITASSLSLTTRPARDTSWCTRRTHTYAHRQRQGAH